MTVWTDGWMWIAYDEEKVFVEGVWPLCCAAVNTMGDLIVSHGKEVKDGAGVE